MGKMVVHEGKPLNVKPFRLMTGSELPTKRLATELDTKWNPIFCKVMEAPDIHPIPNDVNEEFVQSSYAIATEYLKQIVSYIWSKTDEGKISKYTLGTWSKKVTHIEIELHETPGDISRLPLLWEGVRRQISPREAVGKFRRVQFGECKCHVGRGSRWIQVWQMSCFLGGIW